MEWLKKMLEEAQARQQAQQRFAQMKNSGRVPAVDEFVARKSQLLGRPYTPSAGMDSALKMQQALQMGATPGLSDVMGTRNAMAPNDPMQGPLGMADRRAYGMDIGPANAFMGTPVDESAKAMGLRGGRSDPSLDNVLSAVQGGAEGFQGRSLDEIMMMLKAMGMNQ